MKLPPDSIIAEEKITRYLLQWRPENDKSAFLARAGYDSEHWRWLVSELRNQVLPLDASFIETTNYGDVYEIRARLAGPNKVVLKVVTIWMTEKATGKTKFITLFPDKEV